MISRPPIATSFPYTTLCRSLEAVQAGEVEDLVLAAPRVARREPEHDRVDADVVARGEVHVEADPELDERRQPAVDPRAPVVGDRKGTRLNSSHANISYAVFC